MEQGAYDLVFILLLGILTLGILIFFNISAHNNIYNIGASDATDIAGVDTNYGKIEIEKEKEIENENKNKNKGDEIKI